MKKIPTIDSIRAGNSFYCCGDIDSEHPEDKDVYDGTIDRYFVVKRKPGGVALVCNNRPIDKHLAKFILYNATKFKSRRALLSFAKKFDAKLKP